MTSMRRASVFSMVFATLSLMAASAVHAQSLAVGKKIEVNIDASKVAQEEARLWEKYGGWCAIKDWHPAVKDCAESKDGDVTLRTLTLADGGIIKEKLIEQQKRLYRYEIIESPLPVKNYAAQFSLTPDDDDADELNFAWSAVFDANGKPDREAREVINGIFNAGLDVIKKETSTGAKDQD